jgi:hypothetical protein
MKAVMGAIGLSFLAAAALADAQAPETSPRLPSPPRNCGEAGLLPLQIPSCGEFYTLTHSLIQMPPAATMPAVHDSAAINDLGLYPDGLLHEIGPDALLGAIYLERRLSDR